MAAAMLDLITSLRFHEAKLTPQETKILEACERKAVIDYSLGFLVSSCGLAALLKTTTPLSTFSKFFLAGGSASIVGLWSFKRSLDQWVDPFLDMDGSRMQRELATIIVNKYRGDPGIMQRLYRRFYSENVYDETSPDKPVLRWRYKSFYEDNGVDSEGTHGNESHGNTKSSPRSSGGQKAQARSNKVPMNPGASEDPMDMIFGCNTSTDEIDPPVVSTAARANSRGHRRSERRRRKMNREAKHAQLQKI